MKVYVVGDSVFVGEKKIDSYMKFDSVDHLVGFLGLFDQAKEGFDEIDDKYRPIVKERLFNKPEDFMFDLAYLDLESPELANHKESNNEKLRLYNKNLTKIFKCTPSKFRKLVNDVLFKTFVCKYEDKYVRNLCIKYNKKTKKFGLLPKRVQQLSMAYTKIVQADKDGLWNIIPLIFAFNKSPDELKALVGSSLWKQLAKFSNTRNNLIVNVLKHYVFKFNNRNTCLQSLIQNLNYLVKLPSTILIKHEHNISVALTNIMYYQNNDVDVLKSFLYASRVCKGSLGDKVKVIDAQKLFFDCNTMLNTLEARNANLEWSMRRLKEEHDVAAKKLSYRDYDSTAPAWLGKSKFIETFEHNGYTATILSTPAEIAEEGRLMGHCVATYATLFVNGLYVVYSIKDKEGNRVSTLGLNVKKNDSGICGVSLDQHHGKFNRKVEDKGVIDLASKLILSLAVKIG